MNYKLNWVIFIVYMLMNVAVVFWGYKRTKSSADYFVAGRSLGVWVSAGTYFATMISTWSLLGAVGFVYDFGWSGYWQFGGTVITSVIAAAWFGAKLRSTGQVSLADVMAHRYQSDLARAVTGLVVVAASVIFLTVQSFDKRRWS